MVRVVHDIDQENCQVLHGLGEQFRSLNLLLWRGCATERVLSYIVRRLRCSRIVHLVEQESKRESDRLSNLLLHLGVELFVFVLPNFRHDQEMLDKSLKSIKPQVRALICVSLLDCNADDIHKSLHESLFDHVGGTSGLTLISRCSLV